MAEVMVLGNCWSCGSPVMECPDCVVTVSVDPETNCPPDVAVFNGRPVHVEPSPEAVARAEKRLLCDNCVSAANASKAVPMQTAEERHERHAGRARA